MWHEAKKQERKIHGIIVDYRKRAERRREFYEKIKQDPTQFLRVHAVACKIHLDPAVALAAEGPGTMMPWQGDTSVMIDRFDARAHLDFIPGQSVISAISPAPHEPDEDKCFYERYRTLVQNEGAGISEEQCLNQIRVDEMFPDVTAQKPNEDKEKLKGKRAAIGFSYEDGSKEAGEGAEEEEEEEGEASQDSEDGSSSDTSLSDIDIDINVDVDELTDEQKAELNSVGERYGMKPNEYVRMLERDKHELDMQKRFKEIEEEKALYSGRKSRRERRMLVEKRLRARGDDKLSPPSYASRDSPTYPDYRCSRSRSRSTSPEDTGKVTFITSFGQEQEEEGRAERLAARQASGKAAPTTTAAAAAAAAAAATTTKASKALSRSESHAKARRHHRHSSSSSSSSRSSSRSPTRGRSRHHHSRSRSSSRSDSRGRHRRSSSSSSSYSRSRSRSPHRGSRRSRSRSANRHGPTSHRSHSWHRRSRSRSRSRSPLSRSSHGWAGGRPRSRSRSRSRDRHRARSRSRSPDRRNRHPPTPPGLATYKRSGESSVGNTPGPVDKKQLTPKERLKLKMQKALNKQHKADKIKQHQKQSAKEQEQIEREEELREMTRQFRHKEQEKKEWERSDKSWRGRGHGHAHNPPRSRSRSRSPERRRRSGRDRYSPARRRSRSRSFSPRPSQYRY